MQVSLAPRTFLGTRAKRTGQNLRRHRAIRESDQDRLLYPAVRRLVRNAQPRTSFDSSLAEDTDFGAVLAKLIRPEGATLQRAHDAVLAAGRRQKGDHGARDQLLAFATGAWTAEGVMPPTILRLLQVAAASGAKAL